MATILDKLIGRNNAVLFLSYSFGGVEPSVIPTSPAIALDTDSPYRMWVYRENVWQPIINGAAATDWPVFDTVADLRGATNLRTGIMYATRGQDSVYDRNAHMYTWSASRTEADDGVNVVWPSTGQFNIWQ